MDIELYRFYGISVQDDTVEGKRSSHLNIVFINSYLKYHQSKLHLSDDASALDEKAKSSLKLGLFSYPVLQAADILVHR